MSEHHFDRARVGRWSDEITFAVDRERTVAYAEATNDPTARHLKGAVAPPVFAVVPVFTELAATTLAAVPDELTMRILHGEQDFRFHRPIVPGETLRCRARVAGIHGKSSGVVVTTVAQTRDEQGKPVNEQYFAAFFRGGAWPHEVGTPPPPHRFDEALRERAPDFTVRQRFDDDQTFRYAGPSGDTMPIHLDDEIARRAGLPGIIVHGLCTMAFTSHAILSRVAPEAPERLRRLAVRFSAPARPGQEMTTSIWRSGAREGRDGYAFESTGDDGTPLIKDGLAEVARA
ncbi:MaoC/PaaZ C-terminal domain-containing protein [Nonomuraea lactucae]|uniref:MaoC/PaaZ C-terminal domain-containing protein n=1 Tax=Nonomuraea lactucae TaxID=2249762 RepID=UPI000DE2B854|nr:MaoC/PaaZ C-terminal domain-containing protein [Nonomuraea lactucae]